MTNQPCPQCGTSNRESARFCANCGFELIAEDNLGFVQLSTGRIMYSRYTIVGSLGKGGMGAVYLASETIANRQRQVVLKEMLDYYDPGDPQGEAKARKRFESEAATLVSLNFAGIPQIFDFFSEKGRNYIVMQFIKGSNLESGLTHTDDQGMVDAGEPFPPEDVRRWGIQICKVLENLATQNVVHMDIKPANLILDEHRDVWLVDFGTAKAHRIVQPGGSVGMQKSSVYGTAGYAPPEQYVGKAEPRSDIYSLAATMYHLLTDDDPRRHPFNFPRLDDLPEDLAMALRPALEQEVSKRVDAVGLRQSLESQPAAGMTFSWKDGMVSQNPEDLVGPSIRHWDEALGYFTGGDWDGWFKALRRNDVLSLLVRARSTNVEDNLALDSFLRSLDPSIPLPRLHLNYKELDVGSMHWGRKRSYKLEIENRGGGWLQGRFEGLPKWIQIRPLEVGFTERKNFSITINTAMLPLREESHKANVVLSAGAAGQYKFPVEVNVIRPGWLDLFQSRRVRAFGILAIGVLCIFATVVAAAFVVQISQPSVPSMLPAVGNTNQQGMVFTSNRNGKVEVFRLRGDGILEQATYSPGRSESWSPVPVSGSEVLFTSNRHGKREVYRLTNDGLVRVTHTRGDAESWSPVPVSGSEILFVSNRDGKAEIYRLDGEGVERVTRTPGEAECWSPVPEPGGGVLFVSNRDGKREIYRLGGDGVERVTYTPGSYESWSPIVESSGDILFVSNRDGKGEVYRLGDGGIERVTHTRGGAESWSPLPEIRWGSLLFVSNRDGKSEIYRLDNQGLQRVTWTPGDAEAWLLTDW